MLGVRPFPCLTIVLAATSARLDAVSRAGIANGGIEISGETRRGEDATAKRSVDGIHTSTPVDLVIASEDDDPRFLSYLIENYSTRHSLVIRRVGGAREVDGERRVLRFLVGVYRSTSEVNVTTLRETFGRGWAPRARMTFWVRLIDRDVESLLREFWNNDAANVNVIGGRGSANEDRKVFTFHPFRTNGPRRSRGIVEETPGETPFPNKFDDLNNESLPISMFVQFPTSMTTNDFARRGEGADVRLLRVVSARMNFFADVRSSGELAEDYATTVGNRSVGIIGEILNGRAAIVWNRRNVDVSLDGRTESTYPYARTRTGIVVRKAKPVPVIERMLLPFPLHLWLVVCLLQLVLVIVMIAGNENDVFPRIVRLLLFQNFGRIRNTTFHRILGISWIAGLLVIAVVYQTYLVKDLARPGLNVDIDTLDDLYRTNARLYVGEGMSRVVNASLIPRIRRLAARTVEVLKFDECVRRLSRGENVACAVDAFIARFLPDNRRFVGDRGPLLHAMREPLTEHWSAILVKRGLPYLPKFDELVRRLLEGGFHDKWMNDALAWYRLRTPVFEDRILTMKHFEGVFELWIVGLLAATIAFLAETYGERIVAAARRFPRAIARLVRERRRNGILPAAPARLDRDES